MDRVFVPASISESNAALKTSQAYFCPYNMALPGMIRSAVQMNGLNPDRQLTATVDFEGEAIITLGRAVEFITSGADLVINCAPFGCMPGNITAGIFQSIQKQYGVPIMNLFFDGENSNCDIIDTYLASLVSGTVTGRGEGQGLRHEQQSHG